MHRNILQNPILRTLPLGPLAELLAQGREQSFAPGEALIQEGGFNRFLYVLEEGVARILSNGTVLAEIGEGEIVGAISTADMSHPLAEVIAADAVLAIAFPIEAIGDLGLRYPAFAEQLRALGLPRPY
jgi:CRP-like cAMP-binding protein